MDKDTTKLVRVGIIRNTHGNQGEVLVSLDSSEIGFKNSASQVWLGDDPNHATLWNIENYRKDKDSVYLKLRDINTIEEASFLKGLKVYFNYEQLSSKPWNVFSGYRLKSSDNGIVLGKIVDVDLQNVQPAFIIKTESGTEKLIPAVDELIDSIDHDRRIIHYQNPKGLFDED